MVTCKNGDKIKGLIAVYLYGLTCASCFILTLSSRCAVAIGRVKCKLMAPEIAVLSMVNGTGKGRANASGTGADAENPNLVEGPARGALASIAGRELSDEEWLRARAKA